MAGIGFQQFLEEFSSTRGELMVWSPLWGSQPGAPVEDSATHSGPSGTARASVGKHGATKPAGSRRRVGGERESMAGNYRTAAPATRNPGHS